MSRIHVCLVSEQTLPNLIPMRMENYKPDGVFLLESPDMRNVADRLEKIIKPWGIKVERRKIEPFDYSSAQDACLETLAELEGYEVTLNVTGGTKLMAFAAFDVFKDNDVIYIDTQNGKLHRIGKNRSAINLSNTIDVNLYLNAYGRSIINNGTDKSRVEKNRPVFKSIVEGLSEFGKAISEMNRLIRVENKLGDYDNKNSVYPYEIKVDRDFIRSNHGFEKMLRLMFENGIINPSARGFVLPTYDTADFCAGGWLEEYVYDTAVSIIPQNHIMMNIVVEYAKRGSDSVKNEHDVVFVHNNQLYILECKTGNLDRVNSRDKAGTDAIYKLDSLRDAAGGVYGRGMIVSYRVLNDDLKRRAVANRLAYCDGANLKNLSQKIKEWIRK